MKTFHIPIPCTHYKITGWGLGLILSICAVAALAQISRDQITTSRQLRQPRLEIYTNNSISHGILYVTGIGKSKAGSTGEAQQRLMALRAARVNGYRNLVRTLRPANRPIQTGLERIDGFIQGATVFDQRYHRQTGTAEATIAYFYMLDDESIYYLQQQGVEPVTITQEEYTQRNKQTKTIDELEWKQWQRK